MTKKIIAVSAAAKRPDDPCQPDLGSKAVVLFAGALMALAASAAFAPAFAQDFDVFHLNPGEVRQVQVWVSNPYVRICNDLTSASNVAIGVGSHRSESLQPGMCTTDDVADRFVLRNEGTGQAMVTYRPVNIDGPDGG
jgi:hypothetical protein